MIPPFAAILGWANMSVGPNAIAALFGSIVWFVVGAAILPTGLKAPANLDSGFGVKETFGVGAIMFVCVLLLNSKSFGKTTLAAPLPRSNINFKSSTHQTPRYAQDGLEGEKGFFDFELKLLADVGLVGLPNAGKSTLLSVISKAKPKIADYPFTTLHPNLGIVKYDDFKSFVIADIPGIIEGASKGKGLGHQFLTHIERNRVLLFLIDSFDEKPHKTFNSLKKELSSYNKDLLLKPKILIRSKADVSSQINEEIWKSIPEYYGSISSVTQFGINNLILKITKILT